MANKFAYALLGLTLLYLVFHIGRWYERKEVTANLRGMFEFTTDADFIIPDDLEYGGEVAMGNCVFGDGLDFMTNLGKYTYGWTMNK